jgi:hypothetical protein
VSRRRLDVGSGARVLSAVIQRPGLARELVDCELGAVPMAPDMPSGEPGRGINAGVNLTAPDMPSGEPGRGTNAGVNLREVEVESGQGGIQSATETGPGGPSLVAARTVPVIELGSSDEYESAGDQLSSHRHTGEARQNITGSDAGGSGGTRSSGQASWYNLETGLTSEANSLLAAPTRVCDFRVSC